MRILVVEDNIKTANYLCGALRENFFIPEAVHDGKEAIFMATTNQYDVIVLDVMLPTIDGWTFIKTFRERNQTTPVIFLTAKDHVEDRVRGIELGADDYLVKPFAFSELLVRIKSLLRRTHVQSSQVLQIADLVIDLLKHKVFRNSKAIDLTQKEFLLLLLLAKRSGEVLSRTYIAEQVWDIHFDCDTNVIDVAIKRLREKIDKDFEPVLIHTIRGAGYVLEKR